MGRLRHRRSPRAKPPRIDSEDLIDRIVREAACPVIVLIHDRKPEFIKEGSKRGVVAHITDADVDDWQSSIDIVLRRFAEYHDLQGAFGPRALIERPKASSWNATPSTTNTPTNYSASTHESIGVAGSEHAARQPPMGVSARETATKRRAVGRRAPQRAARSFG